MSRPTINIWPALPKSVIRPEIYGHFAEHLGRCIYEGVWVGERAHVPNEDGLRLDVLAALKHLRAPVVRWPGGRFADDYHWRDGVGPRSDRPMTANIWWHQGEPNEFGTGEFMRFCRALGSQPYLCANVGSGSPHEAREWVEYCNFGGDSSLSALRARDGSPEPHGVKYWGVGNENWGSGGCFSAGDYAGEFARYGSYMKAMSPAIELVACGAQPGNHRNPLCSDWNHDFCAGMKHPELIDHIALHRHFSRGSGSDFSDSDYRDLFADVFTLERDLKLTEAVLAYHYPDKFIGIVVDEWGMWHPEAQVDNGLEQPHTLRDALLAASVLNLFNRWSHRVTMANIAQTINVLQCLAMTQGDRIFLTPTYHVFDMMRPHMGARAVTHETDSPSYSVQAGGECGLKSPFEDDRDRSRSSGAFHNSLNPSPVPSPPLKGVPRSGGGCGPLRHSPTTLSVLPVFGGHGSPKEGDRPAGPGDVCEVPLLDASVSIAGRKLLLTVANRSLDADLETVIQLRESRVASVSAKVMGAASPHAANSFAAPSSVASKRTKVEAVQEGTIIHVFPRHSLTALAITLE